MSGKTGAGANCGHGVNQFYDQGGVFCPDCRRNVGPVYTPREIAGIAEALHAARIGCGGSSMFDPPCRPADHADAARRLNAAGYSVIMSSFGSSR